MHSPRSISGTTRGVQPVTSPCACAEVGLGLDSNGQSPTQKMDVLPLSVILWVVVTFSECNARLIRYTFTRRCLNHQHCHPRPNMLKVQSDMSWLNYPSSLIYTEVSILREA